MAAKNDITGDSISTRINKGKKNFDDNIKLIKPSCLPDCKYLINTLTKCRVCDWKDESLIKPKKGK